MKNRLSSLPVLAGALTVALAMTAAGPAHAADSDYRSEAVSDHIAEVAPAAAVVAGQVEGQTFSAAAGNTEVAVPLTAPGVVDVTAQVAVEDSRQTISTSIELPQQFAAGGGAPASDGTVVYSDGSGVAAVNDAIAVQTLSDGSTRVQTVLASPDSKHEFEYGMDGFTPIQDGDGNVGFVNGDGVVVPVEAAWARDANGAEVATHYEVRGDKLVQVVTPSASTAYPVVADPTWAWWNAAYGAKLNKTETRDVANGGGNAGVCGLALFANPVLAGVCAALAGYLVGQANIAHGAGECVIIVVAPAPSVWRYKDGDCY